MPSFIIRVTFWSATTRTILACLIFSWPGKRSVEHHLALAGADQRADQPRTVLHNQFVCAGLPGQQQGNNQYDDMPDGHGDYSAGEVNRGWREAPGLLLEYGPYLGAVPWRISEAG